MRLNIKGHYAVRAMLDLAMQGNGNGSLVLLKDIAERKEIPERYLEQIMASLKNARLVSSTRGSGGGYAIAREPSAIKLRDIIRVSIGDICLVDCVQDPATCSRSPTCATRDVWVEVSQAIDQVFEGISLDDLADRQRAKLATTFDTYSI